MAFILVACEESQAVTKEFRRLGNEAFSCDLLPASGGEPQWHFQQDVESLLEEHDWDALIAFPPCTYLAVSGNRWFYHPDDKELPVHQRRSHPKLPDRQQQRKDAIEFFMRLANASIPHIAIENPVGIMSTTWRKPNQIIQPYQFGDSASKKTCLWLKNLPNLVHTDVVDAGERVYYKSGKSHPKWYAEALTKAKTPAERASLRSKTFPGIAKAMAEQWGNYLNESKT